MLGDPIHVRPLPDHPRNRHLPRIAALEFREVEDGALLILHRMGSISVSTRDIRLAIGGFDPDSFWNPWSILSDGTPIFIA